MNKSKSFFALAGFFFFMTVVIAFGGFYQVDQGDRAVILRNGQLTGVAEPGLGIKIPVIDSVRNISVRDQSLVIPMEAYSYDQQSATIQVSVTYRVPPDRVAELYSEFGTLDALQSRVIERRTPDAFKNVFGKFTAARAIQERESLGIDALQAVTEATKDAPLQIVGVQVEEVGFSEPYENSIEKRMLAQVEVETTRQKKQTEEVQAEIKVIQAKAEADSQRERYQAEADGIRLRGEAEAGAIKARATALASNANLVDLIAAEKWNGALPSTMVPGATVPFIGVK